MMPIVNATISEDEKNRIKQYLLGQLAEADEEMVEQRLMSDQAFSEEFDIVVDEIATSYAAGEFTGNEKTQVEQYFLRSPQRREKVQFICEFLRQIGEDGVQQGVAVPVSSPTLWQRVISFWAQPSLSRTAMSLATVLIVGGLVFWVISFNSKPTTQSFELAMSSTQRYVGVEVTNVRLNPGVDELWIKLKLPTPAAPQYRAFLRGEGIPGLQLEIETQDAESVTVKVPADQLRRGYYAIALTEINNGNETPLRDEYQFAIE